MFSSAVAVFLLVHWNTESAGAALIGGILYPKESETREVRSLDGIWAFRKDESQYQGFKEHWYDYPLHETGEVIPMPVPSSYNDITQERSLRDHVGFVWYERTFFAPERWHLDSLRVWLRFGSVHYLAHVVVITVPKYNTSDIYRQPVGIRTVRWNDKSLMINGKNVYIRGVGKHEDSDIRGKGLDYALITKDFNLLKWLGINAFRTSHYPYAEEIMDFADQQGIMVIDECPSVDTDNFSEELLKKHSNSLAELIRRDKNRPSVIMWSIANEPRSSKQGASWYFKSVVDYIKKLDTSRPVTAAIATSYVFKDLAQYLDIISFNRYNSWYQNTGRLETIRGNVEEEATSWHKKYNKPVLMSEYGADTIAGLHLEPAYVWSEEYQVRMLSEHFKAFDNLREKGFFIGEMIWNFADFKTAQTYTRVGGNKKGILTRERQPKASAHHLRVRNFKLAQEIDNYRVPPSVQNLEPYTAQGQIQSNHIEL
ncbi:hypothetical protein LSTR_LSTR014018 [Laodelphax striatellus]|uniref:Glycoside hydrolase family 2 catalytic domain-containing protein n=1 Tax=Laodelphax striatellus TaxID=195883 RepID=A0A482X476_LAOST|nr:hypothetical protein LSTR_LSTR014018 [Laodelphax striatellus]